MADPNINQTNSQLRQDALETASIVQEALQTITDNVVTAFENALGGTSTVAQALAKDLQQKFNSLSKTSKETATNIYRLQEGLLKAKTVQEQINKRKADELSLGISLVTALKEQGARVASIDKLVNSVNGKVKDQNKTYKNLTDAQKTIVQQYAEALRYSKEQTEELEKQKQQAEEIEVARDKSLGISGKLLKTLGGIRGLGDSIKKAQEDLNEYAEEYRKKNGEYPSQMQSLGKAIQLAGKSFVKGLLDPAILLGGIVTGLIQTIRQVDKAAGDTARGMNMTYSEAVKFRKELKGAADASNSQYITSKGLLETNLAINQALGTSVKLTDKNVQAFTELRVTAGLTNEELMGIQALTITNGKSLEENTGEIMAQAKITGLRNGVLLNEKEVLKGIKDISAATTLTLGKNPGLLAEAAATAKSLGMEMSQIEQISNSLLDFQSSIENELSAELLLGKQLNLETARYAALTGDVATVAAEVAAQLGTSAEFGQMNRVQQEAIAKAVGMNREDLAKTLYLQDQLQGLTAEQAKEEEELLNKRIEEVGLAQTQREMAKEGIKGLKEQADMATQFNMVVEKIQENFVKVAIAIMPFVEGIAGVFGYLSKIPGLIPAILSGLVAMKVVSTAVAAAEFATASSKIFGTFAGIPLGLGIPLAIAAVAGLAGLISSFTADDLYSPGQGTGGYGKRTLLAPEGAFRLNDSDNIIATTNPIDVNDMISGPRNSIRPQSNISQGSAKSEISIAPASTQINLNLNGSALGNAVARQNYKIGNTVKALGGVVDYSAPL
jgi:hypothetical protein